MEQYRRSNLDVTAQTEESRTSIALEAVKVAVMVMGKKSRVFPGRDRLHVAIKERHSIGETDFAGSIFKGGDYWYGPWRSAMAYMKKNGYIKSVPNSATYVSPIIGSLSELVEFLEKKRQAQQAPGLTSNQLWKMTTDEQRKVMTSV